MNFRQFLENNLLNWFGNSKVVDPQGKPLPVFHGTPKQLFSKFAVNANRSTEHEIGNLGIWFTSDPAVASNFASKERTLYYTHPTDTWNDGSPKKYAKHVNDTGGVYKVYLKIENPAVFGHSKDGFEELMDERDQFAEYISGVKGEKGYWRKKYINTNKEEATKKFANFLKSKGHDGIILMNTTWDANDKKPNNQYIVFSPGQIKSVFSKNFDPKSTDITD